MYILAVDINNGLEELRLFKTHRGAFAAMLAVFKDFSNNYLACTREAVNPLLESIRMGKNEHDLVLINEEDIEGWVSVFVTSYGGSISTKEYPHGSCCECSITSMDEMKVEDWYASEE